MKTSLVALAAASTFFGDAAAAYYERRHNAFHEKRHYGLTTGSPAEPTCVTSWTTWYGEPTYVAAPPAPTTSAAETSTSCSSSTSTYVAPTTSAYVAPVVKKPKPHPPKPYSPPAGGYSVGGGDRWAITYSPYQGNGYGGSRCKTAGEVSSDIAGIAAKGFKTLRIYATDCDHLPNVGGAAKAHGLKLILGVFIDNKGICGDTYKQVSDIKSHFNGDYSQVEALLIGNEALFNGFVSGGALAGFIGDVKKQLRAAGYQGPVGTADTVAAIQQHGGEICGVIDIVSANIHPFFNGAVLPDSAGAFLKTQMDILGSVCGGNKPVISSETGWPHAGPNHGASVPSYDNQARAIKSIIATGLSGKIVFFADSDDLWKAGGSKDSVEPWFGCGSAFS